MTSETHCSPLNQRCAGGENFASLAASTLILSKPADAHSIARRCSSRSAKAGSRMAAEGGYPGAGSSR